MMGSYATAIICWGIDLGSGEDFAELFEFEEGADVYEELQEKYAGACGVDGDPSSREHYKNVEKVWQASGCDLVVYGAGYDGVSSYIAMVKESKFHAYWEAARGIPQPFEVRRNWEALLRDFCEKLGLEWKEPKWLLSAHYG